MDTKIKDIIKILEAIAENKDNQPQYILGGYIVGATIIRDDIDELNSRYPELERISELGSELETIEDDNEYAASLFQQFQKALIHLKQNL